MKFVFSVLIYLAWSNVTLAQVNSIDLEKTISETVHNHLEIDAAQMSVDIAQQNSDNQKWSRWPTLQVQVQPGNSRSKNNTAQSFLRGAVNTLTLNAVANLNWVVYEGKKQQHTQESLNQQIDIEQTNKYLKIEDKIARSMDAYFKALIAKEEMLVFQETLGRARDRYQSILSQVNLGYQSNYDALRYKNRMLSDSISYVTSTNDYTNALIELNRVIGNRKYVDYEIEEGVDLEFKLFKEERLLRQLLKDNHQLNLTSLQLNQKMIEEDIIKADLYPSVSFNTSWNNGVNRTTFNEAGIPADNGSNSQFNYGVSITQSLFNQRRVKNALKNNELERIKMSVEMDGLETELTNTVRKLVQEHNAKIELMNLQEEVLRTLKRNIDLEEDRYLNGLSSLLDFNQLQQEYTNALRTKLRTVYSILLLNSRVLGLTGGLRKYYDYGG